MQQGNQSITRTDVGHLLPVVDLYQLRHYCRELGAPVADQGTWLVFPVSVFVNLVSFAFSPILFRQIIYRNLSSSQNPVGHV